MAEHMLALPWTEELLTRSIENSLYHGKHMTFCRKKDDRLALVRHCTVRATTRRKRGKVYMRIYSKLLD